MEDNPDNGSDLAFEELHEITLLIPGEHFFCECISVPAEVKEVDFKEFALQVIEHDGFSPYPLEQLAWGFFVKPGSERMMLFATPFSKLKSLGWQNLELFRRVFPSFVSLFGFEFEKPTIRFLQYDDTLTIAAFEEKNSIPTQITSLSFKSEEKDSLEVAKSKLLSSLDLDAYEVESDILVVENFTRTKDGFFRFEHRWLEAKDPNLGLDQEVMLPADELWMVDLRHFEFKSLEQKRRKATRLRWRGMVASMVGIAAVLVMLVAVHFLKKTAREETAEAQLMFAEVPKVREDQKLLEKLRQNKLGGIDVFGSLGRLAQQRAVGPEGPTLWFTEAHFESRNELKLDGEGKNVEAINTFVENLENEGVAVIRKNRSGEEIREVEGEGGRTTFKIEFQLLEENLENSKNQDDPNLNGSTGE